MVNKKFSDKRKLNSDSNSPVKKVKRWQPPIKKELTTEPMSKLKDKICFESTSVKDLTLLDDTISNSSIEFDDQKSVVEESHFTFTNCFQDILGIESNIDTMNECGNLPYPTLTARSITESSNEVSENFSRIETNASPNCNPMNMYSAFMMSFGLDPIENTTAKTAVLHSDDEIKDSKQTAEYKKEFNEESGKILSDISFVNKPNISDEGQKLIVKNDALSHMLKENKNAQKVKKRARKVKEETEQNTSNRKRKVTKSIENAEGKANVDTTNCEIEELIYDSGKIILDISSANKPNISHGDKKSNILKNDSTNMESETTQKLQEKAKKLGNKDKSEKKISKERKTVKRIQNTKEKENIPSQGISKKISDFANMLPFTGNYKLAEERNKLRYAHQLKTGEVKYRRLDRNKCPKTHLQKKGAKKQVDNYEYAISLCELTIDLVENANDDAELCRQLGKFFSTIVTSLSQKHVPQFLLAIKMIRGCEDFSDETRSMAQKCYYGCRAMYGVPMEKSFESVFVDEVNELKIEKKLDVEVVQNLLEFDDETFLEDGSYD